MSTIVGVIRANDFIGSRSDVDGVVGLGLVGVEIEAEK